jgi:exodeoxyribonuclease VII small subunit
MCNAITGIEFMNEKKSPLPTSIESALERLETIVNTIETTPPPLETLINRYEEGVALLKLCQEKLTTAEQRIDIISRNARGEASLKPFDSTVD